MTMNTKQSTRLALILVGTMGMGAVTAGPLAIWGNEGFTQFADDEGHTSGPGVGGQPFDAEYFYYKQDGDTLSIGLQTGFDVLTGSQLYGSNEYYYAGDLALSFDNAVTPGAGAGSTYEYGIDFGLITRGFSGVAFDKNDSDPTGFVDMGSGTGQDTAGLYQVTAGDWSNDVIGAHHASDPFAMQGGALVANLSRNDAGLVGDSFYRIVSFSLTDLGLGSELGIDAHWTMSCGNDFIDGHFATTANVPEPTTLPLLGLGLLGLIAGRRKLVS
ncbi:MAG: PEP-CTERM sorting domain-containing protein [Immundisolibacteraceae bacterium]|nr:PEP-CTERM sorting domain-containing protein [Immundisolibacteraceae bacterium]